jgi:hypothetical protein
MQVTWRCVIFLLLCCTVACVSASMRDVVGNYRVENADGYATLALRSDMTFLQLIHFRDGRELTASGTWQFDISTRDVELQKVFSVAHDSLSLKVDVLVMPAEKTISGTVRLICDPDWDIAYKKY